LCREYIIDDNFNEPGREEFQARGQRGKEKRQTDQTPIWSEIGYDSKQRFHSKFRRLLFQQIAKSGGKYQVLK
jgi:hypothetical protein